MIDTKQKILDTAERLFSEQGYSATSLRRIIAEAGVNLAAIHYHFGTKEDLLDQVVTRRIEPLNQERLALLDQLEAEAAPAPVPLEKLLEAVLVPVLLAARESPHMVKLMGRLYAEDMIPVIMKRCVEKHFSPLAARFFAAFGRALPELPPEELLWRAHFMQGSVARTLFGPPHGLAGTANEPPACVARRLIAFLSAGLRAPAAQTEPSR